MRPIFAGLAAAAVTALFTITANAADPAGTYLRPSTGTEVGFYECGGKLCAKVSKIKDPAKQNMVGTVIIKGMDKAGDNKWKGDLLNLEDGKTYSGHVTVLSPKEIKLEGCVAAILCKGETWTKVN